jgi:hypothetical protein
VEGSVGSSVHQKVEEDGIRKKERKYWKNQLGVWERKVLRRMFGPLKEHGRWMIRMNAELEQCYKTTSIVTTIRTRR